MNISRFYPPMSLESKGSNQSSVSIRRESNRRTRKNTEGKK